MDPEQQDYDDATLDQQLQDERAREEEILLSGDVGYTEFLRTLANTGNISWHLPQ